MREAATTYFLRLFTKRANKPNETTPQVTSIAVMPLSGTGTVTEVARKFCTELSMVRRDRGLLEFLRHPPLAPLAPRSLGRPNQTFHLIAMQYYAINNEEIPGVRIPGNV